MHEIKKLIFGITILAVAVTIRPTRDFAGGANQTKPIYQPTGSEGSITGKISFEGEPPQPKQIDGSADPACEADNSVLFTQDVIVKAGKLANVFVYVQSGDALNWYSFEAPVTDALLAHHGCQFVPHVLGMQIQQTLKIANDDDTAHNTHFIPKNNPDWNQSSLQGTSPLAHKFTAPELFIPVKCNQHPWEKAYVAVLSHPFFAVSARNGSYQIAGLPPGQYTVVAWHERFGEQSAEISVGVSEKKDLDFTFKQPAH